MKTIRKHLRKIAIYFLSIFLYELIFPAVSFALTSGPTQPEAHGFEPIGTTDMVDLFSGDFAYNIPLLDVGGYPLNIAYHSGVTLDEEASWVGLGWSLNPGVINRDVRGIPDDFKGEPIVKKMNMKDNITVGINGNGGWELLGFDLPGNLSLGLFYNNYKGYGIETGAGFSWKTSNKNGGNMTAGLGVTNNSQSGVSLKPSFGFESNEKESYHNSVAISGGFNSRQGLEKLSFDYNSGKSLAISANGPLQGSLSFGYPTYTPSSEMPITCETYALHGTIGTDWIFNHPKFNIEGYYTNQYLTAKVVNDIAYGTLYQDEGANNERNLMDVNLEKDNPVNKYSAATAIPFGTEDIFSVQGQGISGQFKPFRNDAGVFHDAARSTNSSSLSLGLEFGVGNLLHAGFDVNDGYTTTKTRKWNSANMFSFSGLNGNNLYEPVYIKNTGENLPAANASFESNVGGNKPVRIGLLGGGASAVLQNQFLDKSDNSVSISPSLIKTNREPRAQVFTYLTATEASKYGLDKKIYTYPINTLVYSGCNHTSEIDSLLRVDGGRKPHHISEVTITNTDGSRYVYGLPAYNNFKLEATFAVDVESTSPLVHYNSSNENSTNNQSGRDHYFQSQATPPYAHSYFLTGVLSPDYVDLTDNGISDDDLGTAVKFNYSKAIDNYQWRAPYGIDSANYNDGMRGLDYDQKASYSYGSKEVWYTHSIESKNMVAMFFISNREDALPVSGENGGRDTSSTKRLRKLDKIELYSKADLIANDTNAVPIKVVHFKYDYSLCPGIPNSIDSGGKLTLTEIYFTYGKSNHGKLNSYKFTYANNRPYSFMNNDRWGNYKGNHVSIPSDLSRDDYPYVVQKSDSANVWASTWCISEIKLPSGGKINVNYESDDYGYVMNSPACDMFFVAGFGNSYTSTPVNQLYNYNGPSSTHNNYLFVNLSDSVSNRAELYSRYLEGHLNHLYFNCNVKLRDKKERIKGYAKVEDFDVVPGNHFRAWIKLKPIQDQGNGNPIFLAAMQTLRLSLPSRAFPCSEPGPNASPINIITALLGFVYNIPDFIMGYRNMILNQEWCKYSDPSKSWIRLNDPNKKKIGGGVRVSKITMSDEWQAMVSNDANTFSYGQEYSYTKLDEYSRVISSGVACWEPALGKEENPHCIPLPYEEKAVLAPSNFYYAERPLGESLFPAPSVGYSKVTVKNLSYNNINHTSTGHIENEFYTAKDFPTKNDFTPLDTRRNNSGIVGSILAINTWDYMTCSQGFYVEVNDMHGKPKGTTVYDANGGLISNTSYQYKVNSTGSLENTVSVVNSDGSISSKKIGEDIQIWQEQREQETNSYMGGIHFNVETTFIPFFVIGPIPFPIPSFSTSTNRFRSSATTKFIKHFGVLEKVTVMENGSSVITQNLAYDSETGQALLTKTINEFNDTLFNFTYPAHWAYQGMGPAYKNVGAYFKNVTINQGEITTPSALLNILVPGDEVSVSYGGVPRKGTVVNPGGQFNVIDFAGDILPPGSNLTLKIIRSGRRNQQPTPIGTLLTHSNPFAGDSLSASVNSSILNSSIAEFSDKWKTSCTPLLKQVCIDTATEFGPGIMFDFIMGAISGGYIWAPSDSNFTAYTVLQSSNPSDPLFHDYSLSELPFYALTDSITYQTTGIYIAQVGPCKLFVEDLFHTSPFPPIDNLPVSFYDSSHFNDTTNTLYIFHEVHLMYKAYLMCPDCNHSVCTDLAEGDTINPYTIGLAGIWRPQKSYVYYSKREPNSTGTPTDIRYDGAYSDFTPFWTYNNTSGKFERPSDPDSTKWRWNSEITLYDQKGNEVENVDPLNRYSSALFGYNHSLAKAVASNSRYRQIANDNFEDYNFTNLCGLPCAMDHFSFLDAVTYHDSAAAISNDYAHTGLFSLKVTADSSAQVFREIRDVNGNTYEADSLNLSYILKQAGCIDLFSPDSNKTYLLSAWVREAGDCHVTNYTNNSITVSFAGSGQTYTFSPSGPVIEGWQRYEAKFLIPVGATRIYVSLNSTSNTAAYFDDVRIHPFNGNLKAFVYNPSTLRLMATLDENNYATFYEYDEEGSLVRLKKETERGIMTIKESRNYLKAGSN